jgi:hypothetical protein
LSDAATWNRSASAASPGATSLRATKPSAPSSTTHRTDWEHELVQDHEKKFANGVLVEEREALFVRALAQTGQLVPGQS